MLCVCQKYRSAQDKVICLLFQLMDEWRCRRADRDYRLKFPDDLVAGGENGESLNGQIWFGAECLASGSNIMNHEAESETLRPMAKLLTNTLEQLRLELRHGVMDIDTSFFIFTHQSRISQGLMQRLQDFDILFAKFELDYVQAMLPIKTVDEIEKLHELTVLFSEAVAYSLKKELIAQLDMDECHPHVLIAIPRLAIIYGLIHCQESPIFRPQKDLLSKTFKDFHSVLHRVRELIAPLRPLEVDVLERMLTNEDCASLHNSHYVVLPKKSIDDSCHGPQPATNPTSSSATTAVPSSPSTLAVTSNSSLATASSSDTGPSPLVVDERGIAHHKCTTSTSRYSHSYPQRGNPASSFANYQRRPDSSLNSNSRRLRAFRYHRRRHSDPLGGASKSDTSLCRDMGSTLSLITTMKELRSRTAVLTLDPEDVSRVVSENNNLTPEAKGQKGRRRQRTGKADTRAEQEEIRSQTSITSSSDSSDDSFQSRAKLAAKSPQFISSGTRQLLQRLFVTIAGIADQLQSNSAADLRVILRHVFQMYTVSESDDEGDACSANLQTDSDSVSVEEALEAREDATTGSPDSPSSIPTSPTSSSSTSSPSSPSDTSAPALTPDVSTTTRSPLQALPDRRTSTATSSRRPSDTSGDSPVTTPQTPAAAIHNSRPEPCGLTSAHRPVHESQRIIAATTTGEVGDRHLRRSGVPAGNAERNVRLGNKSQRRRIQSEGGETSARSLMTRTPDPGILAPIWVPDELVASCTACDQTFTLLRRRHHCRNCGQIYCNTCSSHAMRLSQFGYTKPVRVCDPCFVAISSYNALHAYRESGESGMFHHRSQRPPSSQQSPSSSSSPAHNRP